MSEESDLRATSAERPSLLDLDDPDAEFFLAAEKEGDLPAYRRALVVIVSDREPESWEDTGRLVTELLAEDDFTVDGIVIKRRSGKRLKLQLLVESISSSPSVGRGLALVIALQKPPAVWSICEFLA